MAWREWLRDRTEKKNEKLKRLDKADKQTINLEKKQQWEVCLSFEENYRQNKKNK